MLKKLLVISILVILLAGCSQSTDRSIVLSDSQEALLNGYCKEHWYKAKHINICISNIKEKISRGYEVNESTIDKVYKTR